MDTDFEPRKPTVDLDGVPFWVCAEFYSGSGRLSRTWIEQAAESPDKPTECGPDCPYWNDDRSPWSHDMSHIAYPFNGMGGEVVAGPFDNKEEAEQAEFELQER